MLMTQQESETEPETENNQVLRDRDQNERDWDQCSQMHKRTRCWWNCTKS